MALTKSWTAAAAASKPLAAGAPRRLWGWLWLIAASTLVAGGIVRVYSARTENFPDIRRGWRAASCSM